MNNKCRFSIITVCYNAQDCIEDTIKSLLSQDFYDYEYIIKDGKSTDNTMRLVNTLVGNREQVQIISQEDDGIYDAMNIAVSMARGEYIYFLNAGDCFSDKVVLRNIDAYLKRIAVDIVYGNVILLDNDSRMMKKYSVMSSKKFYFMTGDCICHQAIFAQRGLFSKKNFDVQYRVCADKEWELFHITSKASKGYIDYAISVVPMDGYAREHVKELELETVKILKKYYERAAWVYLALLKIKRNKFVLNILHFIEKILFHKKVQE